MFMSRRSSLSAVRVHRQIGKAVIDTLERRTLMCGESHASVGLMSASQRDLPAAVVALFDAGSGHITETQYRLLAPEVQVLIDPHEVEDDRSAAPMDYDRILGIPSSVSGVGRTPEADSLPDFFPQLDSAISVDQTSQPGRTLRIGNGGLAERIRPVPYARIAAS